MQITKLEVRIDDVDLMDSPALKDAAADSRRSEVDVSIDRYQSEVVVTTTSCLTLIQAMNAAGPDLMGLDEVLGFCDGEPYWFVEGSEIVGQVGL